MAAKSSAHSSEAAQRYATAFYDLAVEENAAGPLEQDLAGLKTLIVESEDLARLISLPVYSREDQEKAIRAIMEKAGGHALTLNLVSLLARNGRLPVLPEIINSFLARCAEARGEAEAEAMSAVALSADQESSLKSALEKSTGKKINLSVTVDPSLLGGLIVRVGSKMIDSSLRTKLNRMKLAMKEA